MATVTVEINGRPHQVGCAEGQQERVRDLAAYFDALVRRVGNDVGQVGDLRLFLMAGLLLADENSELKAAEAVDVAPAGRDAENDGNDEVEARVAETLEAAAQRVERLLGVL